MVEPEHVQAAFEATADLIGASVEVDELADRLGYPAKALELIDAIEDADPDDVKMWLFTLMLQHAARRHPERFDLT